MSLSREVISWHNQLNFDKGTKLFLHVSYATDKMIKVTIMYAEVFLWTTKVVPLARKGIDHIFYMHTQE